MDTLTIPAITREVKRLSRQEPNHVAKAAYVRFIGPSKTPTPSCLLGVALYNLGVPITFLRENNKKGIEDLLEAFFEDELVQEVYKEEIDWLSYVQNYQDDDNTWRESVSAANKATKTASLV